MSDSKLSENLIVICLFASAVTGCASDSMAGHGNADSKITAEVRNLFTHYPVLEPPNLIDVQTVHRVVYLYGTVDTELQRELAESVARQAKDATKVVNAIGINGIR
jgi:osmotically-inducible protein OsmY